MGPYSPPKSPKMVKKQQYFMIYFLIEVFIFHAQICQNMAMNLMFLYWKPPILLPDKI